MNQRPNAPPRQGNEDSTKKINRTKLREFFVPSWRIHRRTGLGRGSTMHYEIHRARVQPELRGLWDSSAWRGAQVATIDHFLPESSDHHPRTEAKVLYDDAGLYVLFRVFDRYVICKRTQNQELTSKDSCVEVYFEPFPGAKGYLNFEMNCGGTLLLFYVTDPTR